MFFYNLRSTDSCDFQNNVAFLKHVFGMLHTCLPGFRREYITVNAFTVRVYKLRDESNYCLSQMLYVDIKLKITQNIPLG